MVEARGVRLEGVSAAYGVGGAVLHDVDLELLAGSFTAVVGPNGSGKSTLLRLLAGLLRAERGRVDVFGEDPSEVKPRPRARRIAYVPQGSAIDLPYTALELVLMGRYPHQGLMPFDREVDLRIAHEALERVEAGGLADRLLPEMSGGERQRVLLARAFAQEPELLLLDEPAAALDLRHQVETYRHLSRLREASQLTVVVVSHDLNLPAAHADGIAVLSEGKLAAYGAPRDVLTPAILEPVYRTEILEISNGTGTWLVVAP